MNCRIFLVVCILQVVSWGTLARGENREGTSLSLARESISSKDARRHVNVLSDDMFEGREAGSRGGRAAAGYLLKELERHGLKGGGAKQAFDQPFDASSRNLLAVLEGSDPLLKQEVIVVGAHYDHVGYGNQSNSYGPLGHIHNGADDNASGVAALLELIEASVKLDPPPKRTILFAFWDGEEKGLLGSKHWLANPTIALSRVRLMMNMDMVGRLRNRRLEICGARTAVGLRELVSRQNSGADLLLDFSWEMREDSDHHPFYSRQIPVVMLHTGLHNEYHRPSDDAHLVNEAGIQDVARLAFNIVLELAGRAELAGFRPQCRHENPQTQAKVEAALPPLPSRLGVAWDPQDSKTGVLLTEVTPASPAEQSGLRVGDRILRFSEDVVSDGQQFQSLVVRGNNPVAALVERAGSADPLSVTIQLRGAPTRIGINWRTDDAEPGCVALTRVVAGSAAALAGLRVNDRILAISGRRFASSAEFQQMATTLPGPIELEIERQGQISVVKLAM